MTIAMVMSADLLAAVTLSASGCTMLPGQDGKLHQHNPTWSSKYRIMCQHGLHPFWQWVQAMSS